MLKNLKIGQKLVVSFILIALLTSISGAISAVIMKSIDGQYSFALTNYGFAQGDIGKALAVLGRVDGNVHDAISYMDLTNQAAARQNVQTQAQNMSDFLDGIDATLQTGENRELLQTARSAWNDYLTKANELMEAGRTSDALVVAQVQTRVVDELDPYYLAVYNALSDLMDSKISTGSDLSTQLTQHSSLSFALTVVLIIAAFLISVLLGVSVAHGISRPVKHCTERLKLLAQGNLAAPVPEVKTRDETGDLANATATIVTGLKNVVDDIIYILDEMGGGNFDVHTRAAENYIGDFKPILHATSEINTRLSNTMAQINQAANHVSSGSEQVSSGSQALSQGATEQASAVQELAATMSEITGQVQTTADNALQAKERVGAVSQEMVVSNQEMEKLTAAMRQISESSNEISKIIKTIEDIAFQTNILALNAAVEAARAGEAGKGFAVVADEVRNLATKSQEASQNTAALIENSLRAVENGTAIAFATAQSLSAVVEGTREATDMVDKISTASTEQARSVEQVSQGIDQISSVVQTNSATAEESAATSQELSGQSQLLKSLVSQFRLKSAERTSNSQIS